MSLSDGLRLRITRVFMTPEDIRQKFGIYANFSIKLIMVGQATKKGSKPQDIELCAINSLSLCHNKEGKPYIGSMRESNGKNGTIYAFQPFPIGTIYEDDSASKKEEAAEQRARQQKFIEDISALLIKAYEGFQKQSIERQSAPIEVPNMLRSMPARVDNTKKESQDVPF